MKTTRHVLNRVVRSGLGEYAEYVKFKWDKIERATQVTKYCRYVSRCRWAYKPNVTKIFKIKTSKIIKDKLYLALSEYFSELKRNSRVNIFAWEMPIVYWNEEVTK